MSSTTNQAGSAHLADLAGRRVAVVSGGGTGIGKAIVMQLVADGFHVIVTGRRRQILDATVQEASGSSTSGTAEARVLDAEDPAAVEAFTAQLVEDVGTIDAVVCNAGSITPPAGDSLQDVAATWRSDFAANVLTAVLLTTALTPYLRRPGGRVVLIGSMSSRTGGGSPSYVAAKSALNGWVLALSARLAGEGITANVVMPGFVPGTGLGGGGGMPDEIRDRVVGRIATGRAGRPEDTAGAVSFIVSPAAAFVTGQVLEVNGGTLPPNM
jgi:3-oxoacyl-[acyl-carrier protein] reductase